MVLGWSFESACIVDRTQQEIMAQRAADVGGSKVPQAQPWRSIFFLIGGSQKTKSIVGTLTYDTFIVDERMLFAFLL
jgi:hypothetical protein